MLLFQGIHKRKNAEIIPYEDKEAIDNDAIAASSDNIDNTTSNTSDCKASYSSAPSSAFSSDKWLHKSSFYKWSLSAASTATSASFTFFVSTS